MFEYLDDDLWIDVCNELEAEFGIIKLHDFYEENLEEIGKD